MNTVVVSIFHQVAQELVAGSGEGRYGPVTRLAALEALIAAAATAASCRLSRGRLEPTPSGP